MRSQKTLTEVLLEVTNQEVLDIAAETLEEERGECHADTTYMYVLVLVED